MDLDNLIDNFKKMRLKGESVNIYPLRNYDEATRAAAELLLTLKNVEQPQSLGQTLLENQNQQPQNQQPQNQQPQNQQIVTSTNNDTIIVNLNNLTHELAQMSEGIPIKLPYEIKNVGNVEYLLGNLFFCAQKIILLFWYVSFVLKGTDPNQPISVRIILGIIRCLLQIMLYTIMALSRSLIGSLVLLFFAMVIYNTWWGGIIIRFFWSLLLLFYQNWWNWGIEETIAKIDKMAKDSLKAFLLTVFAENINDFLLTNSKTIASYAAKEAAREVGKEIALKTTETITRQAQQRIMDLVTGPEFKNTLKIAIESTGMVSLLTFITDQAKIMGSDIKAISYNVEEVGKIASINKQEMNSIKDVLDLALGEIQTGNNIIKDLLIEDINTIKILLGNVENKQIDAEEFKKLIALTGENLKTQQFQNLLSTFTGSQLSVNSFLQVIDYALSSYTGKRPLLKGGTRKNARNKNGGRTKSRGRKSQGRRGNRKSRKTRR